MLRLEFSLFSRMLRLLRVNRLAVIDAVEVEFGPGLNVLTGETGAGKSILVEAVGLLLGGRASADLVRTGEESASIEALFERGGEELLVRRDVSREGRSRAFVNGGLATAAQLRELASGLIELHGQHEHQTLLDPSTHVGVLDAFAGLSALLAPVHTAYDALRVARERRDAARAAASHRDSRLELVTFQLGELDRAALKPAEAGQPGEDVELAAARQVLASAERVERLCQESYAALYESDGSVLASLGGIWRRLGELAAIDPRFQPYVDARDPIKSQLEDLAFTLRRYADGIEASPAKLQQIEDRLALLERLKRKYGPTLDDVLARREALRHERSDLERGEARCGELDAEHAAARAAYVAAAGRLSAERRRAASRLASELESSLGELALERTRFEVRFGEPLAEAAWTAFGVDAIEFFVSPNPGEELRPLARIVSGGELSRIMLAIKTLTAASRHGFTQAIDRPASALAPGLVFDEVDAGIGGRVADVVGRKLRVLGSAFQVLCITHLPQIAAYADTHFQIEKAVEGGRTRTSVRRLDRAGRVDELARMLGGEAITEGLRRSAREMLEERASDRAARAEAKAKGESEDARTAEGARAEKGAGTKGRRGA
jgi:DNA repair protein RecN (Recombination protein N)